MCEPNLCACAFVHCVSQTPLPDQEGPSAGSMSTFELMSSKDLAYQMTMFDWELFSCVHEVRYRMCADKLKAARGYYTVSVYSDVKILILHFELKASLIFRSVICKLLL